MSVFSSASASSSAFHQRKFEYGIFLSFCGKDTRKNFTDYLYSALRREEIVTFRDDKSLERGHDFAPDLLRAIGESWGSIIVLSQGYAFSNWCLDELVEIMRQREERGHSVYPIFFYVEPSDLRHQRKTVKEAFEEHERKYSKEKTQRWRLALQQVTAISGWELNDQHEADFLEGIVKQISEKLNAENLDEQEVEKLKDSFQTIKANLVDAENEVYMKKGEAVKVRYDKLKRLAYDIDDVLDEYKTALLKSKIERDYQAHQIPSTSSPLPSEVHNNTLSTISLFGGIALRIKELNKRIAREKDDLSLAIDKNSSSTDPKLERPETTSFFDESVVYGRDHDKLALVDRLLVSDNNGGGGASGNGIPVIAIVGMGGLGKTTLARLVFKDKEVKKYFHKRIWVCVSDPFDEVRIAKAILESLKGKPTKFNELQSLLEEIEEIIEGKKFFLVLDDVWTEDENKWEQLKACLSSGSKESRILVTTRKENVATMMGCSKPLIKPGVLCDEDSWSLFSEIALTERSNENLKSIGRQLVKRCAGLPLAIKTLASLLRFKGTREQWQRVLDSEMWELQDYEIFKKLYAPLLLSYFDLPMPVKQCFRYCAIFPKDHEIKRDETIKLWVAQGFLGEGDEMEMIGEECFDNLAIRGFFQEFEKDRYDGSITGCKMHDIVHDFAQFLTKPECLVIEGEGQQRKVESCHENVRHLTLIPQGHDPVPIIHVIKCLHKLRSFLVQFSRRGGDDEANLYASLSKLSHQLISVRMLGFPILGFSPMLGYSRELETKLKIPKEMGRLIHLRSLSFEGNERLVELPETLCDLCNLQTLNIRFCYRLKRLPCGMEKLINLRHLLNRGTITTMPKGLGRLTSLQTLENLHIDLKLEDSFGLADLGNLIHLRGNLEITGLVYNLAEEKAIREAQLLKRYDGLRELTLSFSDYAPFVRGNGELRKRMEAEALLLRALHPPRNLLILNIRNYYFLGFPTWMRSLTSLNSLDLSDISQAFLFPDWMTSFTSLKNLKLSSIYRWESLPPLGKLPYLESLSIEDMRKVKKVGEEFLGIEFETSSVNHIDYALFPNLKQLRFFGMSEWEEWEYEYEKQSRAGGGHHSSYSPIIMPKLESLEITLCPKLKTLPHLLLQGRALQELDICGCDILHECYNKDTGRDWHSISHIPYVLILGC